MNFLKNIFGKKAKLQESTNSNQVQQQESKSLQENAALANAATEAPQLAIQVEEGKGTKPNSASPAEPNAKSQEKPEPDSNTKTPSAPWRTFPIFISSTFADMQAERDHLKNVVFPKVEEELQKRRIKLETVDLRWGVDTTSMEQEDEREASVLKVCLDEIRRCRPFFIGLLGDRYGWVPPLERMKTALVGEKHIVPEKGKSVTDLEIEFGVLASQEQLVRSVFYFREPLPYATFGRKKAAMFSDEYNPDLSEVEKKERKTSLDNLKTNIRDHFEKKGLKEKVKPYSGTWDAEKEKITGLEPWGDQVYTDILAECESHAKDTWDKVPKNWQEQELALLDAFIENNTSTFCGRKPLLETLKQHLLSGDTANWGLVLTGESGSGKSAVFSMASKMLQQENCLILAHSAGLSPRAKSVADLLQIWNKQLAEVLGIKEELNGVRENFDDLSSRLTGEQGKATITPIEKLQEKFLELLQLVSATKRVVLLIDALDRFEPTARAQHLSWLPSLMPQNVRLLCTAITGTEQKAANYHKGLLAKSIDIFSTAEAKEMLDALCLRQHKSLPAKIEKIILDKKRADGLPSSSSPLWLSLAVNMLMTIDQDDFEKISKLEGSGGEQIETYLARLASDFSPLPGNLFISLTHKAEDAFGKSITNGVFDFIAITRNGLREKDLEKLLENRNWDSLQFANLRRWFKAHLVMQGDELQWNLAHSILRSALTEHIEEAQCKKLHDVIAGYLMSLHNDPLKATETIYHSINAGNDKEAALYYSSDLTDEEADGATCILAEIITKNEDGLNIVSSLPELIANEFTIFQKILDRFVYNLHDALQVEGNLKKRLILLENIKSHIDIGSISDSIDYDDFLYDIGELYSCLFNIRISMGDIEAADNCIKDQDRLIKKLHDDKTRNMFLMSLMADSCKKRGIILELAGQFPKALDFFNSGVKILEDLYISNPNMTFLKEGISKFYTRIISLNENIGNIEEAYKYIEKDLELMNDLIEVNPLNFNQKVALTTYYAELGRKQYSTGNYKEALEFAEKCNQLCIELFEANPHNVFVKDTLANTYYALGDINQIMGHLEEALNFFEKYYQLKKELCDTDRQQEKFKVDIGISLAKLGEVHQALGNIEIAFELFQKYNQLEELLYKANPFNIDLKNGLALSYRYLSSIHNSMGHIEEALNFLGKYVQLNKELNEVNPTTK